MSSAGRSFKKAPSSLLSFDAWMDAIADYSGHLWVVCGAESSLQHLARDAAWQQFQSRFETAPVRHRIEGSSSKESVRAFREVLDLGSGLFGEPTWVEYIAPKGRAGGSAEAIIDYLAELEASALDNMGLLLRLNEAPKNLSKLVKSPSRPLAGEAEPFKPAAFGRFFKAQLQPVRSRLSPEATSLLFQLVEGNPGALLSALKRLEVAPQERLEASDLALICESQAHFERYLWAETLFRSDSSQALRMLQSFLEQDQPLLLLLGVLHEEIKRLLSLSLALQDPDQGGEIEALCKQLRLWYTKRDIFIKKARSVPLGSLLKWLNSLLEMDGMVKRGLDQEAKQRLTWLVLEMSAP